MRQKTRFAVTCIVVVSLILTSTTAGRAQLVSTSEALGMERGGAAGATVDAFLARQQVAAELKALGVDPEVARLRASALSVSELEELAERIHEAPAGAGVIEVIGITFVVLLILELLGVIDIFKKI